MCVCVCVCVCGIGFGSVSSLAILRILEIQKTTEKSDGYSDISMPGTLGRAHSPFILTQLVNQLVNVGSVFLGG